MKWLIISAIILSFLLSVSPVNLFAQEPKTDIQELYKKQGDIVWGDIFEWTFNRKEFRKSYALIIGIGDYQKGWQNLEAPYYDAVRVKNYLINDAGFDYVATLTNAEATKDNINKFMEEIFSNLLKDNDRFFFYYSGHSTQRLINNTLFGYLPMQNSGLDTYGDMISMSDIEYWDKLISRAKHALFVLDCCFSGLAGVQMKSPLRKRKLARLSQKAHYLITAGTENEESVADLKRWGGSLFTDAFLKGVSGNADMNSKDFPSDGIISLKELMEYIGSQIDYESTLLKSNNFLSKEIKMSPQMSKLQHSDGEFFFISKYFKNQKVGEIQDKKLIYGWPLKYKSKRKRDYHTSEDKRKKVDTKTIAFPVFASGLYFDNDSTLINIKAVNNLILLAKFLKDNPSSIITIKGISDDIKDTDEHNKAVMRNRRAEAVKSILIDYGISPERMTILLSIIPNVIINGDKPTVIINGDKPTVILK